MTKSATISSLLLMFVSMTCFLPAAQATMIGTGQIMGHSQAQQDRTHVKALLNRTELAAQLKNAGVDPVQLQARVDALTDEEVALLADQLDQLPAGSGILGTALVVFLVLLATDILGYTDVFPFVKKTVNLN
ncbi:MAG: PA2779 family protein [Gammaproteobacteria bacterium]|nr:PA2779 family protein [Gammaproteobacteria bacterium]